MIATTTAKAGDIMQPIRLAVAPTTTLTEVRDLFIQHLVSGAPVVNVQGELIGVVSQTDLARAVVGDLLEPESDGLLDLFGDRGGSTDPLVGKTVAEILPGNVFKVSPADPIGAVARMMIEHHIHRVIVAEENKPVGIISSMDLIKLLAY